MNSKDIVTKVWYKNGGVVPYDGKKFANTFPIAVKNARHLINKNWLNIAEVQIFDNTRPKPGNRIYHAAIPGYDIETMGGKPVPEIMKNFIPTILWDQTLPYIQQEQYTP